MTVASAFAALSAQVARTQDVIGALRLTVVEDRPGGEDVLLVERLAYAVDDAAGWLADGIAATHRADDALGTVEGVAEEDLVAARRALVACQQAYLKLAAVILEDLGPRERQDELREFGQQRGRDWLPWSTTVLQAVGESQHALLDWDRALLECWQELAERLSPSRPSTPLHCSAEPRASRPRKANGRPAAEPGAQR